MYTVLIAVAVLILAATYAAFVKFKAQTKNTEVQCSTVGKKHMHRLCPHNNVVATHVLEQKDSLDEQLDILTQKLAEKEGKLNLSKSKIRATQNELDNLHAIDNDVHIKYKQIMENLKGDLLNSEEECKVLQEQIGWASKRRAELKDDVLQGQRLYKVAMTDLAEGLREMRDSDISRTLRRSDECCKSRTHVMPCDHKTHSKVFE